MSKPRKTFIGNLKVLEKKAVHKGRHLGPDSILVKLRPPSGPPFWCEMSPEDYEEAIEIECEPSGEGLLGEES